MFFRPTLLDIRPTFISEPNGLMSVRLLSEMTYVRLSSVAPDRSRIPNRRRVPDRSREPDRSRIPDRRRIPDRSRIPDRRRIPGRRRISDRYVGYPIGVGYPKDVGYPMKVGQMSKKVHFRRTYGVGNPDKSQSDVSQVTKKIGIMLSKIS